jgi:protein-S-isoprenylcysteine O-methyltransferase Ste14
MSDSAVLSHPNVRVPPPLIYVAGFFAGWLIDRRWPLPMMAPEHHDARMLLGAVFIVLFLALMASAFTTFRTARTAIIPISPASTIVTSGPYRVSRNPMYVGFAALYIGVALFFNSWWPLVLLPLVMLVIDRAVIAREERYLRSAFPAEYAAYCARVRRWI